jgi:hypothetical protein
MTQPENASGQGVRDVPAVEVVASGLVRPRRAVTIGSPPEDEQHDSAARLAAVRTSNTVRPRRASRDSSQQ